MRQEEKNEINHAIRISGLLISVFSFISLISLSLISGCGTGEAIGEKSEFMKRYNPGEQISRDYSGILECYGGSGVSSVRNLTQGEFVLTGDLSCRINPARAAEFDLNQLTQKLRLATGEAIGDGGMKIQNDLPGQPGHFKFEYAGDRTTGTVNVKIKVISDTCRIQSEIHEIYR